MCFLVDWLSEICWVNKMLRDWVMYVGAFTVSELIDFLCSDVPFNHIKLS